MSKKKSRLKLAQEQAESAIKKTNDKIGELGTHTSQLYDELNTIQKLFDDIRNVPGEKRLEYEKLKKFASTGNSKQKRLNQITKMPSQKMLEKVLLV